MKIGERLGAEFEIQCAICDEPLEHNIDESLLTVSPCAECISVSIREHEELLFEP